MVQSTGYGTMRAKATYETVKPVCDRLWAEGIEPTADLVLSETGGSRGTVLPLLRRWKDERDAAAEAAKAAEKPRAKAPDGEGKVTAPRRMVRLSEALSGMADLVRAAEAGGLEDANEALEAERSRHAEALKAVSDAADQRVRDAEDKGKQETLAEQKRRIDAEALTQQFAEQADALEEERDAALTREQEAAERVTVLEQERDAAIAAQREAEAAAQKATRAADHWRDEHYRLLALKETVAVLTAERDGARADADRLERLLRDATAPRTVYVHADDDDAGAGADDAEQPEDAGQPERQKQRRRPWTEADDDALREIAAAGGTQAEAAKRLGRPDGIVSEKWRLLGLPVPPRKGRRLGGGPTLPLDGAGADDAAET